MKHVLVTGGAGYIGSHACKALASAGYVPVAYDNLVHGHRWSVKWGPLEQGDIADRTRLDDVLARYRPVAVMHFAAHAYVGESVTNPGKYYRNNVAGTLTLLEAMRDHAIDKLVFSSTCATYGVPQHLLLTEEHPQHPINPYGASKLMVERMLADFDAAHGLRSVCLRYFNAAGADPDGEIGECHDPETHLIPLVLDAASGKRADITVFGSDYDTPDGTCIRDYIHVGDLAGAHVLALQALEAGAASAAYNLGNGQGFSVRQVIDAAQRITGRAIPITIADRRAGDPPVLVGDATRIRDALGWSPRHADLDDMIASAWRWQQARERRMGEAV
ncbi:UDP-glucose 4-epimerase GalE [Thermomonas carbonis]|uniref:UDP-glucose 4-epimerase n=1 Tax=Thermomonas carbonis TaxID=1463158 RepID=A0A7G9SN28_9GAMM|nr:UDP-glucose 4-epimerase GalE [Thermomonas carbonis]QNN69253.1 UDP-glucose 4-epimerase GalE [Thermomonas carbonis]GHC05697.1 UDP-glucose 4-epimerase GalE [Thermomonas carbonis]